MKESTWYILGLIVILGLLSIQGLTTEGFVANAYTWPYNRILQPLNYALSYPWLNYYPTRYDWYGIPYSVWLPGPWNQLTH